MGERFDAVIVGGGPSGSVAACGLARAGWRVALIERGPRHRAKACGHCLHPRAVETLDRLGLPINSMPTVGRLDSLRIHLPGKGTIHQPLHGLLVDRASFDQWLIDLACRAGARVLQPAAGRFIGYDGQSAHIELKRGADRSAVRCSLLIGADGVGSAVARRSGLAAGACIGRKFGFSFDHAGHAGADDAIDMFIVPGGYAGMVQQSNGTIHVGAMVGRQSASPRHPAAFIRSASAFHQRLADLEIDRRERAHMPLCAAGPFPWRPRYIANEHTVLIGDAAGYAEPFTGEGMSWAIESAAILLRVLAGVRPGDWNAQLAHAYSLTWHESIGRRQRFCRWISLALERPWLASSIFRAGKRLPGLTQRLINQAVAA